MNNLSAGTDIWSSGAFAFESPLKDLLDTGNYTLEQLLREDELLQEVKGMHPELIKFLSQVEVCQQLLEFLLDDHYNNNSDEKQKEGNDEDELHAIKYPYMACEVICCEISGILDTIVDHVEGVETSVVRCSEGGTGSVAAEEIDSLASCDGSEMGSEENNGGRRCLLDLFFGLLEREKLNDRLAGYFEKILTMLFQHRPATLQSYISSRGLPLLKSFFDHLSSHSITQILLRLLLPAQDCHSFQSYWSTHPKEYISLLLDKLMDNTETVDGDDEVRVDVAHNTGEILGLMIRNDAQVVTHMLQNDFLQMVADTSVRRNNDLHPYESGFTCVMGIFEVLLLCAQNEAHLVLQQRSHLETILSSFTTLLTHPSTQSWTMPNQSRQNQRILGCSRLAIVKCVHALVLLTDPQIDHILIQHGMFNILLDLFFQFEWSNILQSNVTSILMSVLNGGEGRYNTQVHLIVECALVDRIIHGFDKNNGPRRGYLGHLIIISKTIDDIFVKVAYDDSEENPAQEGINKEEFILANDTDITDGNCQNEIELETIREDSIATTTNENTAATSPIGSGEDIIESLVETNTTEDNNLSKTEENEVNDETDGVAVCLPKDGEIITPINAVADDEVTSTIKETIHEEEALTIESDDLSNEAQHKSACASSDGEIETNVGTDSDGNEQGGACISNDEAETNINADLDLTSAPKPVDSCTCDFPDEERKNNNYMYEGSSQETNNTKGLETDNCESTPQPQNVAESQAKIDEHCLSESNQGTFKEELTQIQEGIQGMKIKDDGTSPTTLVSTADDDQDGNNTKSNDATQPPLYDILQLSNPQWATFFIETLDPILKIQSTPLGNTPPPPDHHEELSMTDTDFDIAASMMVSLHSSTACTSETLPFGSKIDYPPDVTPSEGFLYDDDDDDGDVPVIDLFAGNFEAKPCSSSQNIATVESIVDGVEREAQMVLECEDDGVVDVDVDDVTEGTKWANFGAEEDLFGSPAGECSFEADFSSFGTAAGIDNMNGEGGLKLDGTAAAPSGDDDPFGNVMERRLSIDDIF